MNNVNFYCKEIEKIAVAHTGEMSEKDIAASKRLGGYMLAVPGVGLIDKAYKSGNIDGVKKMYHLTNKENTKSILEEGIKAYNNPGNLTASGLRDAIVTGHIKPEDLANKAYLANNKRVINAIKQGKKQNLIFDPQDVLKVNIPLDKLEKIKTNNPELLNANNAKEFLRNKKQVMQDFKNKGGFYFAQPTDAQIKASFNMLSNKGTTTVNGDIASKYIKGSKNFEKNTIDKVLKHISKNPGKFAKGIGTLGAGAALTGTGIKLFADGMKKPKKTDNIEV